MESHSGAGTSEYDAEARLAAIVESSDDAIFSKDSKAVVTSWNAAAQRLYGYTAEEIIGKPVQILLPKHKHGEELMILGRIMAGERVEHYETVRVTKDGRLVNVSLTASPIRRKDGIIVGASVIARDVSDRMRAEEIERELEKMEFVNLIAHELRTPLAAITGAVHFLAEDREAVREDKRPLVDLLVRQVQRSQSLINDLLDLSRLQSGKFDVSLEEVPLDAALGDALLASPAPEGKSVELEVPSDLDVVADPVRLQQVFTNLLTNAYKYGGPAISVQASPSDEVVEVSFADNGQGLPEEYVAQVFDPFIRADSTGQAGSGLGLAITKGLVEAQGGSIRYERVRPQGACFVCTLKVAA